MSEPNNKLGKYELHEQLGRGGFGSVYRATDTVLGRDVALKVLHPQLMVDLGFIERFRSEARIVASLEHPNIIPVFDLGEDQGRVFLAMRYLPGKSLHELLERSGALGFDQALQVITQVGAGLQAAHNKGLVHRDIKPENILFSADGQAVITDFGLAKAVQSSSSFSSSSGAGAGTPYYRAPELWRGKPPASAATDEYSLACVFSEMLTAERLFAGDTPDEIITLHLLDGPNLQRVWPSDVPVGLTAVLEKALQKDPAGRYLSVEAFTAALQALRQTQPSRIPPAAREVIVAVPDPVIAPEDLPRTETSAPAAPPASVKPPAPLPLPPPASQAPSQPAWISTAGAALRSGFERSMRAFKRLPDSRQRMILGALFGIGLLLIVQSVLPSFLRSNIVPGGYAYYSSNRDGSLQVYELALANHERQMTSALSGRQSWSPVFTESGYVYFTSNRSGKVEIWMLTPSGVVKQFTDTESSFESWSPATALGGYVYFASNRSGKTEIWLVNPQGQAKQFTHTEGNFESWSPAPGVAGYVYFVSNRSGKPEIWFVNPQGESKQFTHTDDNFESWSPAPALGGIVYFSSNRSGKTEIWMANARGKFSQLTATDGDRESWGARVSQSGFFYFTSDQSGRAEVYNLNSSGGRTRLTDSQEIFSSWTDLTSANFARRPLH